MAKKLLIIFILFCIVLSIFNTFVYADELEVEGEGETSNTVASEAPLTSTTSSKTTDTRVSKVNPISRLPEANLGLNNVLSIIIISIGVLLILLAIAILIKLK